MSKQGIPETNLERIYFRISILMVLPTISLLFPDIWGGDIHSGFFIVPVIALSIILGIFGGILTIIAIFYNRPVKNLIVATFLSASLFIVLSVLEPNIPKMFLNLFGFDLKYSELRVLTI